MNEGKKKERKIEGKKERMREKHEERMNASMKAKNK